MGSTGDPPLPVPGGSGPAGTERGRLFPNPWPSKRRPLLSGLRFQVPGLFPVAALPRGGDSLSPPAMDGNEWSRPPAGGFGHPARNLTRPSRIRHQASPTWKSDQVRPSQTFQIYEPNPKPQNRPDRRCPQVSAFFFLLSGISGFRFQVSVLFPGEALRGPARMYLLSALPTMKITKRIQFQNGASAVKSVLCRYSATSALAKRTQFCPAIPRVWDSLSPPFPPALGSTGDPPVPVGDPPAGTEPTSLFPNPQPSICGRAFPATILNLPSSLSG